MNKLISPTNFSFLTKWNGTDKCLFLCVVLCEKSKVNRESLIFKKVLKCMSSLWSTIYQEIVSNWWNSTKYWMTEWRPQILFCGAYQSALQAVIPREPQRKKKLPWVSERRLSSQYCHFFLQQKATKCYFVCAKFNRKFSKKRVKASQLNQHTIRTFGDIFYDLGFIFQSGTCGRNFFNRGKYF